MLVNLIFKEVLVHRSGVRLNFNLQFVALPLVKPVVWFFSVGYSFLLRTSSRHLSLPTFVNVYTSNQNHVIDYRIKQSLNFRSLSTISLFPAQILFRALLGKRHNTTGTFKLMLFKYAMQMSSHVKKWRSTCILKFHLRGPDTILAHNKKTQYA